MYPGHFAAGLALKTAVPRSPTFGLLIGVGLLDLLFGVFVAVGWEGGSFRHLRIPWSHSLLMAFVWSALYGVCYWKLGWRVMAAMFAAVISHWVLDVCVHRPDMGLYPFSKTELGFSNLLGGVGGWFDVMCTVVFCAWYAWKARRARDYGGHWIIVCALVGVLYFLEFLTLPCWVREGYPAGITPGEVNKLAR